jgi:putative ribosome biogenesis GTPase RsgA
VTSVLSATQARLDAAIGASERLGIPTAEARSVRDRATARAGLPDDLYAMALVGGTGVGKSSLLNALEPGLAQRVGGVSDSTHKGRHTTTGTRRVALTGLGGYVADTAGIRVLSITGAAPGRLDACFREFRPYLGTCTYGDCTHRSEPGCAVRAAVRDGVIASLRYSSYRRLYQEGGGAAVPSWDDAGD